jgi:hypothetical protein
MVASPLQNSVKLNVVAAEGGGTAVGERPGWTQDAGLRMLGRAVAGA